LLEDYASDKGKVCLALDISLKIFDFFHPEKSLAVVAIAHYGYITGAKSWIFVSLSGSIRTPGVQASGGQVFLFSRNGN
jgi:hypothetical protein